MPTKTMPILFVDTESRMGLEVNTLDLIGWYNPFRYRKGKFVLTKEASHAGSVSEFIDYFNKLKENHKVLVFFHNFAYDFPLFLNFDYNEISFSNSRIIRMLGNNFEVRDTFNLLPTSLEKLSSTIGLHKVEVEDWQNSSNELLERRVKKDVELLAKIWSFYNYQFQEKFGIKNPFIHHATISSIAFKILKKNLLPINYKNPFRVQVKNEIKQTMPTLEGLIRSSYAGGRTEIFQMQSERFYSYDINSLYPSVMATENFPFQYLYRIKVNGKILKETIEQLHLEKNVAFIQGIFIQNSYVPILWQKINGTLLFPNADTKGIWTSKEIEKGLNTEVIIPIKDYSYTLYVFNSFHFNGNKIKEYYKARKENVVNNQIYKLILNSSYGHFAMKLEREALFSFALQDLTDELLLHAYDINENTQKAYLRFMRKNVSLRQNPAIASFITAYARLKLYNYLLRYQADLLYCDTDSIFVSQKHPEILKNGLGGMKLEKKGYNFIALQPKVYQFFDDDNQKHITAKGVPKRIISDIQDYKDGLEWIEYARPKTILKFHKFYRTYQKKLRTQYKKRKILEDNIHTLPISIKEFLKIKS